MNDHVRMPKTSMVVASRIRGEIVRNELSNGEELIPLDHLASRFGVSLSTLREALRILESESLISIRRGTRGGVRIHRPDSRSAAAYAGLFLQAQGTTIVDVYEARCILEPAAARALASASDRAVVERLRAAVDALRACEDAVEFVRGGTAFHLLMVEQTGNRTLTMVASILRQIADEAATRASRSMAAHSQVVDRSGALARYETLIGLIEAGDVDGAEAHWRSQMETVTRRVMAEIGAGEIIDVVESA